MSVEEYKALIEGWEPQHEGPCCDSCIEDVEYDSSYGMYAEDGSSICCCVALRPGGKYVQVDPVSLESVPVVSSSTEGEQS